MTAAIRGTLFGDLPLFQWAGDATSGTPWSEFAEAQRLGPAGSVEVLRRIAATPGLESRHTLQAWNELRRLGVQPGAEARQLLGVVVEVALEGGVDLLAAYADGTARYYNYSGAGVIWERPDASLDGEVQALLASTAPILRVIGPWEGPRPGEPPTGQVRLNMLAPGGLFFGQGDFDTLARDPLAGPALSAATRLMQALIEKSGR
jgi:hypothetical protein